MREFDRLDGLESIRNVRQVNRVTAVNVELDARVNCFATACLSNWISMCKHLIGIVFVREASVLMGWLCDYDEHVVGGGGQPRRRCGYHIIIRLAPVQVDCDPVRTIPCVQFGKKCHVRMLWTIYGLIGSFTVRASDGNPKFNHGENTQIHIDALRKCLLEIFLVENSVLKTWNVGECDLSRKRNHFELFNFMIW